MYEIDWKVTHIYMAFRNWSLHWNQLHSAWWTAMASTVSQIPSLCSLNIVVVVVVYCYLHCQEVLCKVW
jgi:hypothetical protein